MSNKKTEMSKKQFMDTVEGVCKEYYGEVKTELVKEIEQKFQKWNKMSSTEKQLSRKQLIRKQKYGSLPEKTSFGRALPFMLKAMVDNGGYTPEKAAKLAEKGINYLGKTYKDPEIAQKFQAAGDGVSGGSLIPQDLHEDFIDLLYDKTVVRKMGARVYDMPHGHMTIPKATSGSSSSWVAEGAGADESNIDFGTIKLEGKKLAVTNVISNDLVRESPFNVPEIVTEDMLNEAATVEDLAFIRGEGTAGQPKGIKNLISSDNDFARGDDGSGNVTLDTILKDLMKAQFRVEEGNIPVQTPGWIMSPRTFYYLMSLRGQDSLLFMPLLMDGKLFGSDVGVTNSLPTNLDDSGDTTNDETEIYYGDFNQLIIGDTLEANLRTSQEASIDIGGGNRADALRDDLTIAVLHKKMDCNLRYDKAFARINAVDYGADFTS